MASDPFQRTVKREVFLSGTGLFTGEKSSIQFLSAPVNTGIVFQRVDLPGKPLIPARLEYVKETFRSTRLATEQASLLMVEHLLAALSAFSIDNLLIEVAGPEIPACDGSAKVFVELLDQAGIAAQEEPRRYASLREPIFWSQGDIHLIALPSDEYRISYTLHYPQSALLKSQYFSFLVQRDAFRSEIAPSRTFALYEEIAPFIEKGLIKGGRLENALLIKEDRVLNPEGVRFADEMARHKILDLIGDLSLVGFALKAHVIAVRSGHSSNIGLALALQSHFQQEEKFCLAKEPISKGAV